MLTTKCIHPELMRVLSTLGHGDKVLIADGNYPLASKTGDSEKVYLGLCPGTPTVTQVLETLLGVIRVERAEVMETDDGREPEIYEEFRKLLPELKLEKIEHYAFYDVCGEKTLRLSISTGEKRTFANIILTVGVA